MCLHVTNWSISTVTDSMLQTVKWSPTKATNCLKPTREISKPYDKSQLHSDDRRARCCPTCKKGDVYSKIKNSEDGPERYDGEATRSQNSRVSQIVNEGSFTSL